MKPFHPPCASKGLSRGLVRGPKEAVQGLARGSSERSCGVGHVRAPLPTPGPSLSAGSDAGTTQPLSRLEFLFPCDSAGSLELSGLRLEEGSAISVPTPGQPGSCGRAGP